MKTLYLIRHALPAFPEGSKMCLGITDIPIGREGTQQAKAMAAALPPVTAVYSSPLRRAIQTAQAIGHPVQILSGLREIYAGDWDGLTFAQIRQRYPELYAARGLDSTIPPPGSEDAEAALVRFRLDLERGDCVLLCSDGLTNLVDDQEILFEVVHGANKQQCCQSLLKIAQNRGAPDNVTCVLAQL